MEDRLPDVPKENQEEMEASGLVEEAEASSQTKEAGAEKLTVGRKLIGLIKGKNRSGIVWLLIGLGLLFFLGLLVSVLERVNWREKQTDQVVKEDFFEPKFEKEPGEMRWLFYLDKNVNEQFDQSEIGFAEMSVKVRRAGDAQVLKSVASGLDGKVVVDDLKPGEYEVQFSNEKGNQRESISDFNWPTVYQVKSNEVRELLPTEWQRVKLEESGYREMVALQEYQPQRVWVFQEKDGVLKFFDPEAKRNLADSQVDEVKRDFLLQEDKLYYLKDNSLWEYDISSRLSKTVMEFLFGIKEDAFLVSPEKTTLAYVENGEFKYKTKENWCGEGAVLDEGQRVLLKENGGKLPVDFYNEERIVMIGNLQGQAETIYITSCNEQKDFEVEKLEIANSPKMVGWLDEKTLFVSDALGGWFYDLEAKTKVKYEALGKNTEARLSFDNKYISGRVNGKLVVVDYPAVKSSGVEKHYLLPLSGEYAFYGDDVLGFEGNELVRIALKGNGVSEEVERVSLESNGKEILGEVWF